MKIVDTFIFNNEVDLLLYRLSILDEYIDYFVLVESTYTFSGFEKSLVYHENKNKFEKFNDKIVHIVVDNLPFKYPNINYDFQQQWQNEYFQRNSIERGINFLIEKLNDNDIILTSDVDEIPNPEILKSIKDEKLDFDKNIFNRLALDMYYYNLHFRVGEGSNWHGIKLMSVASYKKNQFSFQQMRVLEHSYPIPIIKNGGWHLSYFGDIDFIIKKIQNFSHQEYNNEKFIDKNKLIDNIKNGVNLLNDSSLCYISIVDNKNLPYKYDIYLTDYYTHIQ
jgi:beta-1,4-mannosyl-glycoprotein beta-1,4-N-acetylglucosaminyltransferase